MKNKLAENMLRFGTKNLTESQLENIQETELNEEATLESDATRLLSVVVKQMAERSNKNIMSRNPESKNKILVNSGRSTPDSDIPMFNAYGLKIQRPEPVQGKMKVVTRPLKLVDNKDFLFFANLFFANNPKEGYFKALYKLLLNYQAIAKNLIAMKIPRTEAAAIAAAIVDTAKENQKQVMDLFRAYPDTTQTGA